MTTPVGTERIGSKSAHTDARTGRTCVTSKTLFSGAGFRDRVILWRDVWDLNPPLGLTHLTCRQHTAIFGGE